MAEGGRAPATYPEPEEKSETAGRKHLWVPDLVHPAQGPRHLESTAVPSEASRRAGREAETVVRVSKIDLLWIKFF